jgi:fibronectin-binding autotransporter adhesin
MSRFGQRTRLTGTATAGTINYWFGGGFVALPVTATGGTTGTAGLYKYHFFTGNGTFAVTIGGAVEICGIGGGGGGGRNIGGGGGAGELDIWTALTVSASNYDVIVGAGGAGGVQSPSSYSASGGITTFKLGATTYVSSLGGGAAGNEDSIAGVTGGSGGGARDVAAGGASGSNTNVGATIASNNPYYASGGGGGATGAGTGGSTSAPGTGGTGGAGYTLTTIDSNLTAANFATFTGMTVVCSGGGGGVLNNSGSGNSIRGLGGTGAGDGGNSNQTTLQNNATNAVSYGSGGGSMPWTNASGVGNAGNGKAGLVIVRYLA